MLGLYIYLYPIIGYDFAPIAALFCVDQYQYTFIRDFRIVEVDGVRMYVVLAKSHPFSDIPEKSGTIRVDSFQQSCVMQSDGNVGSKGAATLYYLAIGCR